MKYEGEFKLGKIIGKGLLTFTDGTHGIFSVYKKI
jgi:hypothetical protein